MLIKSKHRCEGKRVESDESHRYWIYRVTHEVRSNDPYRGMIFGPCSESVIGRHRTKELAVAEMDAVFPRISANDMLLLWDDKEGQWEATEYCYYGPGEA